MARYGSLLFAREFIRGYMMFVRVERVREPGRFSGLHQETGESPIGEGTI